MCGIAGAWYSVPNTSDYAEVTSRMTLSLKHRGPDSHGSYIDKNNGLILSHCRLAIQDLTDAGQQPMFSDNGRYVIVFNGEIYNFRELSADLAKSGHRFAGHSDTEVLLTAVTAWGLEVTLQRLVGMFAFALWDLQDRRLYLCRDRMGEKPLYYGWIDKSLYFASELKAIESVVPRNKLHIDQEVLGEYFKYGYINAPYSIYQNLYKLMPGTFIAIDSRTHGNHSIHSPFPDSSSFSPTPYWRLLDVANKGLADPIMDERDAIRSVDELLNKTISMQTIADVDVGTFLSGGIDSSLVSAIAQSNSATPIRTFTIGFKEKEYDESVFAEQIAKHIGADHTTVYASANDALDLVSSISKVFDEPFADVSQIPTLMVSNIARRDVTVCLSGDGGDELFAGYNRYTWTERLWKNISSLPLPLRKAVAAILRQPGIGLWDNSYRLLAKILNLDNKSSHRLVGLKLQKLSNLIARMDIEDAYQYLLSYWDIPACKFNRSDSAYISSYHSNAPFTDDFIEKALYWDQMNYLPGDNLAKVDRSSMAVSLETRLPLLSHEMVELSWRIPKEMKVRNGDAKWLLKQVLFKYVPKNLVERQKMGFSVPLSSWLRNELYEWSGDLLASSKTDFINRYLPVDKAWKEHQSGKRDHALRLWSVLMYLSWKDR